MSKYEYKMVRNYLVDNKRLDIANREDKLTNQALNAMGKAGWKLQNTITIQGTTTALIFMREI